MKGESVVGSMPGLLCQPLGQQPASWQVLKSYLLRPINSSYIDSDETLVGFFPMEKIRRKEPERSTS